MMMLAINIVVIDTVGGWVHFARFELECVELLLAGSEKGLLVGVFA